jgi:hypothetical protein
MRGGFLISISVPEQGWTGECRTRRANGHTGNGAVGFPDGMGSWGPATVRDIKVPLFFGFLNGLTRKALKDMKSMKKGNSNRLNCF